MNARPIVVSLFAGLVLAAVVVFAWPGSVVPPPSAPAVAAAAAPEDGAERAAVATVGRSVSAGPEVDAGEVRQEVESVAAQTAALGEKEALVLGRCVDEQGLPLVGVTVDLHAWTGNSQRTAQYRLEGGEITWEDPEDVVTGTDGRFEFRIEPPPPYQVMVDLEPEGRVAMRFRWHELPAGEVRDVGDVLLPLGVAVSGRVVDPDGAGLGEVTVQAAPQRVGRGEPYPVEYIYRKADPGGYFSFDALPVGPVRFQANRLKTLEPTEPVTLERPSQDLRIVAVDKDAVTGPVIRGVVVDEQGAPVGGAPLQLDERNAFLFSVNGRSRPDGSFTINLPANDDPTEPAMLHVSAAGYETWHSPEPVAWNTEGLRVVLRAGPPLSLRVTSANDGAPVERYGITLAPVREGGGWSSTDDELRHLGDHPEGLLRIARVTPGKYLLGVQAPAEASLEMGERMDIEVVIGRACDLEVRLQPVVERRVRVVTADGSPVVGARVELLVHQLGASITPDMTVMDRRNARHNSPERVAVLLDDGDSDAAGEVVVRGVTGKDLALRLPGPGHVPKLVQPVRMEGDGPLQVVVSRGAALRGRLGPADILAQLREEGRPEVARPGPGRGDQPTFDVYMARAEGEPRTFPSRRGLGNVHVPVDDDGRIELVGVPPGSWNLMLVWERALFGQDGRTNSSTRSSREVCSGIELVDGQEVEVDIDLEPFRSHPVEIRSLVDGEPSSVRVALQGEVGVDRSGQMQREHRYVFTAADGHGSTRLPAGTWQVSGSVQVEGVWVGFPGPRIQIPAGAAAGLTLDARLARRMVQVLRPDGEPAPGLELGGRPSPDPLRSRFSAAATDREGRTTLHGVLGRYPLTVRHKPLDDWQKILTWQRENPGSPQARAWLDLGEVELLPGDSDELVIRLPDEWLELPK